MAILIVIIVIVLIALCTPLSKTLAQGFKDGWNGTVDDMTVEEALQQGNKIVAIKKVREKTGMSLADAKKYVENIDVSLLQGPGNGEQSSMDDVDFMEGHEFEYFCASLLRKNGFTNVEVTKGSGDQGVDILANKDGVRYAIQCKNYSSPLGNTSVQEVEAGRQFYHCHVGVVITNSTFTPGAVALAAATRVLLWDRKKLQTLMNEEG